MTVSTSFTSKPRRHGRWLWKSWLRWLLAVVSLAQIVSCFEPWFPSRPDLSSVRWLELRLSFDQNSTVCSPWREIRPGCAQQLDPRLAIKLAKEIGGRIPTAPILERGRLRVVLESISGRDEGSRGDLLRALDESPAADLWNDLAVSFFLAAAREGKTSHYFSALEALDSALELEPGQRHALFNRGLLLTRLGLAEEASRSWLKFLRVQGPGNWQSEVRVRLQEVEAKNSMDSLIRLDTNKDPASLLQNWQTMLLQLHESTDAWKTYCVEDREGWETFGEKMAREYRERLPRDTSVWLAGLCEENSRAPADEVRRVLSNLAAGLEASSSSVGTDALPRLRLAATGLAGLGSPLVWFARTRAAAEILADENYEQARENLKKLAPKLQRLEYRQLSSRAWWGLGTIALRQARPETALGHYEAARNVLATGVDPGSSVLLNSLIANAYSVLGDYERAWEIGITALTISRTLPRRDHLYAVCSQLAEISANSEDWAISLLYQDCVVDHVSAAEDPAYLADAYVWRALCHYKLVRAGDATRDLDAARLAAEQVEDKEERELAEAAINLVHGFTMEKTDSALASESLEQAARYFSQVGNQLHLFLARVGRLDIALQMGDTRYAEVLLTEVDDLYRSLREETVSHALVLTLLGRSAVVSDRAVRFYLDLRKDPWSALAVSDISRTTRGLTTLTESAMRGLSDKLPEKVAILALTWLDGHVVSFLLSSGSTIKTVRMAERIDRRQVAALAIPEFKALPSRWNQISIELYQALVAPVADTLDAETHLIIVPDGPLFALPFGLLRHPDGHFAFEERSISVAPNLRGLLRNSEEPWSMDQIRDVVALVDPALPKDDFADRLGGAREEARRMVGALGSKVRVVTDESATVSAFLKSLERYDLVHFGGHSKLVAHDPVSSYLSLAPDFKHPDGRLTARALYETTVHRSKLVVLASCSSASAGRDLPHAMALVRPFLEAGVTRVVGSLVNLEDDLFQDVMGAFYQNLAAGLPPTEALRRAQMSTIDQDTSVDDIPMAGFIQLYRNGLSTQGGSKP